MGSTKNANFEVKMNVNIGLSDIDKFCFSKTNNSHRM